MSKSLQISGLAGLLLALLGLIAYFFTRDLRDPYVLSHLGLGILFLVAYFSTQGGTLVRSLRRRSTRYGIHSAFYSLLFVGILLVLDLLSARYYYRLDLTESRIFSLAPQSIQILKQLRQDVLIFGFFEKGENPRFAELMKSYAYYSPRIRFHPIDPDRHPEMVSKFKIHQLNMLHIRYGEESTNVTETSEEAVTNAILKLTRARKKTVYFLSGHGEPKIEDRENGQGYALAKEALENENYLVREVLLSAQEKVPPEASVLIIAGPQNPLLDHELEAIQAYVRSGGRLLILLPQPGGESLKGFLKDWGVEVGDDIVVDQVVRLFSGPSLGVEPIVETYDVQHPITRGFKERTLFPMVRSVDAVPSSSEGLKVTPLIKTSPTSWAETDLKGVFQRGRAALDPEDKKGPVSIGVAVMANLKKMGGEKDGDAKIVVLGSAGFANNRFINIFFNRDFFLNTINWLVGEEDLISIRARSIRPSRIQFTEREGKTVFYLSFLVLPEILLIIGLVVWWKRR